MEKAITQAINGGYMPNGMSTAGITDYKYRSICNWYDGISNAICHFVTDPLFWQALGKAEGWKQRTVKEMTPVGISTYQLEIWQDKWHNFIDHLIAGKDVDSFFNNLLKK